MRRRKREEKGFTLIEVMIAIVVLAIGLLAVAQMQLLAVKGNSYGSKMSVAALLAQDMIERIRQNAVNVASYNNLDTNNISTRPASNPAQSDYDQIKSSITLSGLPQGRCQVAVAPVSQGNQVTVTVTWVVDGAVRVLTVPTII